MAVMVIPYDLPDAALFNGTGDSMLVWQPATTIIVLGQSNTPERSLIMENVMSSGLAVTKRPTGGEAVILTPRMAVITVAREYPDMTPSKSFFSWINNRIILALATQGVTGLGTKGISDITVGDKKILGSSMHRRENRLVYHAVLNTGEDPQIFEHYLRHPAREPDYRKNRTHGDFVTSLTREGYANISVKSLKTLLYQSSFTGINEAVSH